VHQHLTAGIGGAALTNRSDQLAHEFAVPATANHQEVSAFGGFDQEQRRVTLHDLLLNELIGKFGTKWLDQLFQHLFGNRSGS
jgi:hypothetical protein